MAGIRIDHRKAGKLLLEHLRLGCFSEYAFRFAADYEKFSGSKEEFLQKHGSKNASQNKLGRDRFAEMDGETKNKISHRGRALASFKVKMELYLAEKGHSI